MVRHSRCLFRLLTWRNSIYFCLKSLHLDIPSFPRASLVWRRELFLVRLLCRVGVKEPSGSEGVTDCSSQFQRWPRTLCSVGFVMRGDHIVWTFNATRVLPSCSPYLLVFGEVISECAPGEVKGLFQ